MKTKILLFSGLFILLFTMPAYGEWSTSLSKDKMTGAISTYATSPGTTPTKVMGFPYRNVKAWLVVTCHEKIFGETEGAYIAFNVSPNLSNPITRSGYNLIHARIKWDDNLHENVVLTQNWGSKFIGFQDDQSAISLIAKSNSMLLELDWYGLGFTYFKFQLNGSSEALKKIRSEWSN